MRSGSGALSTRGTNLTVQLDEKFNLCCYPLSPHKVHSISYGPKLVCSIYFIPFDTILKKSEQRATIVQRMKLLYYRYNILYTNFNKDINRIIHVMFVQLSVMSILVAERTHDINPSKNRTIDKNINCHIKQQTNHRLNL